MTIGVNFVQAVDPNLVDSIPTTGVGVEKYLLIGIIVLLILGSFIILNLIKIIKLRKENKFYKKNLIILIICAILTFFIPVKVWYAPIAKPNTEYRNIYSIILIKV